MPCNAVQATPARVCICWCWCRCRCPIYKAALTAVLDSSLRTKCWWVMSNITETQCNEDALWNWESWQLYFHCWSDRLGSIAADCCGRISDWVFVAKLLVNEAGLSRYPECLVVQALGRFEVSKSHMTMTSSNAFLQIHFDSYLWWYLAFVDQLWWMKYWHSLKADKWLGCGSLDDARTLDWQCRSLQLMMRERMPGIDWRGWTLQLGSWKSSHPVEDKMTS